MNTPSTFYLAYTKNFGDFFFPCWEEWPIPPKIGIYQTWAPDPLRGGLGGPPNPETPIMTSLLSPLTKIPLDGFFAFCGIQSQLTKSFTL